MYFHKKEHGQLYYRLVYEDGEHRHDVAEKTRGLDGVVQTTIGVRPKTPVVASAVAKFKQTSAARASNLSGSRLKYVSKSVCGLANEPGDMCKRVPWFSASQRDCGVDVCIWSDDSDAITAL